MFRTAVNDTRVGIGGLCIPFALLGMAGWTKSSEEAGSPMPATWDRYGQLSAPNWEPLNAQDM